MWSPKISIPIKISTLPSRIQRTARGMRKKGYPYLILLPILTGGGGGSFTLGSGQERITKRFFRRTIHGARSLIEELDHEWGPYSGATIFRLIE